jgi:hypothetical protein
MYGRDWAAIEINAAYTALAEERLATWRASHRKTAS